MDDEYVKHRFSMTFETKDLAVVHCLRALEQYADTGKVKQASWGNTKKKQWINAAHTVTFRFISHQDRQVFNSEVKRLIPIQLWKVVGTNDNDPAKRVR